MKLLRIKYISLIVLGVFLAQCSDLSEDPFTSIAPDDFYKDAEDLNKALIGVYDGYQEHYGRDARGYYLKIESLSEFGAPNRTEDSPHLYNVWSDVNNPDMTIDKWGDSYQIINTANLVIGKGQGIQMDEELRQQRFGEAMFLRALTYFNLLRLDGGVPIPETYTQGLDNLEIPRKSVEETYDYIIEDLSYAAENLPLKSEYGNEEIWRASRGAARALLGKVYLYRGSMTGEAQYFEESNRYSKMVIDSREYALESDFRDLWKWWNANNENGIESIFEIQLGHKDGEDNTLHTYAGINIADENVGAQMYHRYGPSFIAYNSYNDQDYRKSSTFLTSTILSTGDTVE